jgi:predicted nucleotidyltransferase
MMGMAFHGIFAVVGQLRVKPLVQGCNQRRFQANPQSSVYAELVALTRKTLGTVPVLRDALQSLLPHLQSAWVYGSVVKQTDTARSDIDVMLVGKDLLLSQVLAALEPAEAQLGRKINPSCIHPKSLSAAALSQTRLSTGCCRSPHCH